MARAIIFTFFVLIFLKYIYSEIVKRAAARASKKIRDGSGG